MTPKPPVINCHTHIFTGGHVPPYLAKTFLPWPFYLIFHLGFIVKIFRFWYNGPYKWRFKPWYKKWTAILYRLKMLVRRSQLHSMIGAVVGIILGVHVFFILFEWLSGFKAETELVSFLNDAKTWLISNHLLFIPITLFGKLLVVFLFTLFFKSASNLIFFLLKKIWSFLGLLPGPESKELVDRYLSIGRFAFHKNQNTVFSRLKSQYPEGTGFVILPMDMAFMGAGKVGNDYTYANQMIGLKKLKEKKANKGIFFPFVFADPRRIREEGKSQLDFKVVEGSVVLEECFIKTYIEDHQFSGFKIYPALGYYPFDEALLPLWKYAADNGLPITSHCIRGTIFYRGNKKKEWDTHPIFEEDNQAMLLPEIDNRDFTNNFTHPLNYLCLLEERLLRKVVSQAKDARVKELFGYTDLNTPLKHDLRHLKLCFAHFGGDDEWNRFLEFDRDNFSSQLMKNPDRGIVFLQNKKGEFRSGKLPQIWKYADWYTIICSLMLQYPNVYADVSYIIHNEGIQPLLKQTMTHEGLKNRVLFGTDFYVVRNHKSEKNIYAAINTHLDEEDFDRMARYNPVEFLKSSR